MARAFVFNPERVAHFEATGWRAYYDVHRRLVGQADKSAFVATMVALHSAIFGITSEQARESAELRVAANTTVDRITSKISTDVDADWAALEEQLRQCYRSIQREMARRGQATT